MEKTKSKKLTIKKKIFFSLIVLVLFLLAIELLSYVALSCFFVPMPRNIGGDAYLAEDPDLGWIPATGASHHIVKYPQGYDIMVRTGNGFRIDEQNIHNVRDCCIITIGDSHTFGFGLKEEQTLVFQLHKMLSNEQNKCLVFNGGVPGYGVAQYYIRLRSLGRLTPGSLVIVYLNPINDLSDLSKDVGYGSPKPYASLTGDVVKYVKPILYDPQMHSHFAQDFDSLNKNFNISTPTPPTADVKIFHKSKTWQFFTKLSDKRFRFRWSQIEPTEAVDSYQDGWDEELRRQTNTQRNPISFATMVWTEISEFNSERRILEELLFRVFFDMKKYVESQQAHLLVVIAEEAYSNQGFVKRLENISKEQFPQYTFEHGWSREAVKLAAQKANIDSLTIEYPIDRTESMFIPYDGHTSADGLYFTARKIVEWIYEQKFAFMDGKTSLKTVVQEGPDINSLDGNGYTRLHYAIQNDDYQTVERLISEGADINLKDRWGETALYIAATRGYKSILEMLIEKGADVNATDHRDQSPLHQAVRNGYKDIVELLIASNVDVNPENKAGQTPLDILMNRPERQISNNQNFVNIRDLLITNGAEISSIHVAAQVGDVNKVTAYLDEGKDINAMNENGRTALHIAVINDQKDIVELLINRGANINAGDNHHITPIDLVTRRNNKEMIQLFAKVVNIDSIHLAAQFGDLKQIKAFLEKGTDINSKNKNGDTPLHIAVSCDHNGIAQLLINNGANVNAGDKGSYTPLYYAIWNLDKDMINLLISKGAEVNFSAQEGDSILYEAVWMDDFDIVKILVDNGAKYDVKDKDGFTALHYAAIQGSMDMVKLFISKGVDTSSLYMAAFMGDLDRVKEFVEKGTKVDAKDDAGWTALYWSACGGQTKVAEFLIDNGADINTTDSRSQSLLHQAAQTGNVELVELLISKGGVAPNIKDKRGNTPLHNASHRDIAALLIDKGADVNAKNNVAQTPLHIACQKGNKEIAELLIDKGADINSRLRNGLTPLHLAARGNHKDIVELLIAKGADLNVKNNAGRTPLRIAMNQGHTEIIELLRKHGAKE
jgi:ankyrin repeat protein